MRTAVTPGFPTRGLAAGGNPPWRIRPWREVGYAALIVLASSVAALAYAIVVFLIGRIAGLRWSVHGEHRVMIVTFGIIDACCLWLAIRRARRTGGDRLSTALAAGPVRRVWLVALLVVAELALAAYNIASLRHAPLCGVATGAAMNTPVVAAAQEGPVWLTVFLFEFTILTAVSEEVLFRGWLWTALRRAWGGWRTALVTGVLFWLMHAPAGPHQLLLLLPFVLALTAVRQWTGSIRGTILLHALQNAGAATTSLMMLWYCRS